MDTKNKHIIETYKHLEDCYKPHGSNFSTYTTPVNFKESLQTPRHRWYGYKEGFSPSFVKGFIDEFSSSLETTIFDPFGGVGTTGLEAVLNGHRAFVMDVNPLGLFAAQTKARNYTQEDILFIQQQLRDFECKSDFEISDDIHNDTVKRYFDSVTLDSLLRIRSYVFSIENPVCHSVFKLALLSIIEEISTHHKNGNGVKRKIKIPAPFDLVSLKRLLSDAIRIFVRDIEQKPTRAICEVIKHSNLDEYILPCKIDIVLTSPPYANCFDYSKVYLTELWVGGFFQQKDDQTEFRENSLISHVHYKWKRENKDYKSGIVEDLLVPTLKSRELWSNKIPDMISGYFSDLGKCLYNLSLNLNLGATVGFVVGNSVYGGLPIATDLILAQIAENLGYHCTDIRVYRKVVASSQQMVILTEEEKKYVRESLVILKWK